jgi:hypothetical protein
LAAGTVLVATHMEKCIVADLSEWLRQSPRRAKPAKPGQQDWRMLLSVNRPWK